MALYTALEKRENLFREIYSWTAPERFWKPKDRSWYVSYGSFFIVIIAFFALLGEFVAIIAVLAFLFLWFVQGSTPPEDAIFTITTLGIKAYGTTYKWKDIQHFWFSETNDAFFLNLDIIKSEIFDEGRLHRIPVLMLDLKTREDIFYTLIRFLDYGEKNEIGFNVLNRMVHGNYVDVNTFLPDEFESQEDINEAMKVTNEYEDLTPNEITQQEKEEAIQIARRKIKSHSSKKFR